MNREQAREIALKSIQEEIQKHGEDAIYMASPMPGKNSWTNKEALDAIINDVPLEGLDVNLIDGVLELDKWKKERERKKDVGR